MAQQLTDTYKLDGSTNPVVLHVTIGYAQNGITDLIIGGAPYTVGANANGIYDDTFNQPIGTNESLATKQLVVDPAVTRIQAAEDRTSVLISITGGAAPKVFTLLSASAGAVGNVVDYLALIDFV